MNNPTYPSRRSAIATGVLSLAAAVTGDAAYSAPKGPGETKVLYFGGDYIHNGVGQERYLRQTFSKTGWRMLFAQASHFITPEMLADTDLLMMTRTGAFDAQGFSPDGIVEERPEPDPFLSPEMERAIIDNVTNRGMGFIAFHCTAGNPEHPDFMKFLGVKPFRTGARLQSVKCHNFNREHPITEGFSDFVIDLDENLRKEIDDDHAMVLFETTGVDDDSKATGGWVLERGRGRVVVLLAGHTNDPWKHSQYRQLHWRAAHWAMKREIPPFEMTR